MKQSPLTHAFSRSELTKREAAVLRVALIGYAKNCDDREMADAARELASRVVERTGTVMTLERTRR
jgi:hypothetical protein